MLRRQRNVIQRTYSCVFRDCGVREWLDAGASFYGPDAAEAEAAGCGEKCQCHEPPEATEEKPKHLTPRARID